MPAAIRVSSGIIAHRLWIAKNVATIASTIQASGRALCHTRSPLRSELRPHRIIHTAATPKGTAFTRPVCQLLRPNDFTSCGIQSASDVEAPAAPEYTSAMISTYLLVITRQTDSMRDPRRAATFGFQLGDQPLLLFTGQPRRMLRPIGQPDE